jgi:O-antigen/teichoic acid export membrane protein
MGGSRIRGWRDYRAALQENAPTDARHREVSERPELLDTPAAGPTAVRGGVFRLVGYGIGVLLTVASAALLFRHLGVGDGGRYVTALALVALVSGVTELGLTAVGVRELATRPREERTMLMRNLLGLRLVLTAAGVAAAVGFAALVGYAQAVVLGVALAGAGAVATAVQSTLGVALTAGLRFGWITVLELLRQVLTVVGIAVLVLVGAGLLPFLALAVPVAVVVLLMTAWVVRGDVPLVPSFDRLEWRALIWEVLPFAAATVIAAVYFRAAMIVLSIVSTSTETGYFGAPFRITEVLLLVPGLVVGAAFPIFARAARDDHERLAYGLDRVFQACAVLGGCLLVPLLLGAEFVIEVVAGDEFAASAPVLRIQSLALMLAFLNSVVFYTLLSIRRYRELLLLAGGALAISIALAAVLGSTSGAEGAAIATVVAELCALLAGLIAVRRAAPSLVPSLAGLPRVGLAVALALPPLLIPGLSSVVAALLGTGIYLAVVRAVGAVPQEFLDAFPLPRRRPS